MIIGIHGLENKPPLDEKMHWWKAAILEGLRRNCAVDQTELAFELVYWADLRYDRPVLAEENKEPYFPDAGSGTFPRQDPDEVQPINAALEQVYEGLDWVQAKTGVTPVDDVILKFRFDDLWHYQSETGFAQEVRKRLTERIKAASGQRLLLVAHSMGSIVAYDVLRMLERNSPSIHIDHFVTLGSPLGLAEVKLKIAEEHGSVRVPKNVGQWTNLADRRDVATVAGALAHDYAPHEGTGIRDVAVLNEYRRPNGEANHHKSYGYLRTPELSAIAMEFTTMCPVGT
ncbi:lipase/acyltransferase domain-containing protein [Methylobacterium durans]|uniref:Alpha/beta hydrolase n=1 Tax=Methylobacterium durans TaxID=2202825 RepID=A0A2U8WEC0_9HYPH|nr:hypothetical protein [Methylobacterium durans]AWN44463.1 hypothetical protein DK389_09540 [Methylobacterium durans]